NDLAQGFGQNHALALADAGNLQIEQQQLAALGAVQARGKQAAGGQMWDTPRQDADFRRGAQRQAENCYVGIVGSRSPLSGGMARLTGKQGIQAPQRVYGCEQAKPGAETTPGP